MIKWIKQAPLLCVLAVTGLLITGGALIGRESIYREIECNLWKEPVLTLVFRGMNEEIYPWQMIKGVEEAKENTVEMAEGTEEHEDASVVGELPESETAPITGETAASEKAPNVEAVMPTIGGGTSDAETIEAAVPTAVPTPEPTPYAITNERLKPLRSSTEEEIKNHISADIYGDAGVIRAAEYEFVQVDESYFDDALFIGDSRTVGLRDYTDLREHADFLCETSLTVYKVLDHEFKGQGNLEDMLSQNDYGKIYLMVGINELGRGTTEDYMAKYTEVIDKIHELEPEALIFIQGVMHVSKDKSSEDKIYNNANIGARNNAVATLADNIQVFYIDVNEAVCDEEGNLSGEYTYDQIHLLGVYNDIWKQFLLNHGVKKSE